MRVKISKLMMGAIAGACALQLGVGIALADKPIRSNDPASFPKGIRDKLTQNPNGSYSYTGNGRLGGPWATRFNAWNAQFADNGGDNGGVSEASEGQKTVCPSSLDDEAMRICLGIPAVKKAVRVKKLNVQLGEAQ